MAATLTPAFRFLAALGAFAFAAQSSARADVESVIAKARARLGTEAALLAVKSAHFVGTYESQVGDTKSNGTIEMIFQKPLQHRSVIKTAERIEITGLNDYESWQRVEDAKDPTRWQLTLFPKEQTKSLRANTWETLEFFRGIEKIGGRTIDMGEAKVDGIACAKISFEHDKDIAFVRYFDLATGRLVQTETAQATTREEGEIVAAGVKFPKKIVSILKPLEGKERTVTVTFDTITVNEIFDTSQFAVPSLKAPALSSPPPASPAAAPPPANSFTLPKMP